MKLNVNIKRTYTSAELYNAALGGSPEFLKRFNPAFIAQALGATLRYGKNLADDGVNRTLNRWIQLNRPNTFAADMATGVGDDLTSSFAGIISSVNGPVPFRILSASSSVVTSGPFRTKNTTPAASFASLPWYIQRDATDSPVLSSSCIRSMQAQVGGTVPGESDANFPTLAPVIESGVSANGVVNTVRRGETANFIAGVSQSTTDLNFFPQTIDSLQLFNTIDPAPVIIDGDLPPLDRIGAGNPILMAVTVSWDLTVDFDDTALGDNNPNTAVFFTFPAGFANQLSVDERGRNVLQFNTGFTPAYSTFAGQVVDFEFPSPSTPVRLNYYGNLNVLLDPRTLSSPQAITTNASAPLIYLVPDHARSAPFPANVSVSTTLTASTSKIPVVYPVY